MTGGRIRIICFLIEVSFMATTVIETNILSEAIAHAFVLLVSPGHALIHALVCLVPFSAVEALSPTLATGALLRFVVMPTRWHPLKRLFEFRDSILGSAAIRV